MPLRPLTPAQRAFVAALTLPELRDEDLWRPGHFDLPVLRRLPRLDLELGDLRGGLGPPPVSGGSEGGPQWWQEPYPGGPMVKVPGFPRALYPPDAASQGKKPSPDGPDVIAYKRTISRAGRWPWGSFDDSYSNAFAHGKPGGNVGNSGVGGVQRQGGIEPDSGWIGEKTFNLLRSIRIPAGLPHAGEPAMDEIAVGLLEDAWQRFQAPPPQASRQDVEEAIVDFLTRSIAANPAWHYSQARPMSNLGWEPEREQSADCSTSSTDAYYWPRQVTGVAVPDPNRFADGFGGFDGRGYTGSLVAAPRCSTPYKIGDLGIYGESTSDTSHVVTCYVPGSASSAEWCSHGSESGPYAVELNYRTDLVATVRPGLMP